MKITVLGCGSSGGCPLIGNDWGQCDPAEPRNRRTRVSLYIEAEGQGIIIDTSPDMREQLLRENIKHVTAVLYTHAHADHCHGIDDLRSINWMMHEPVRVYADPMTMADLEMRFHYIFKMSEAKPDTYYVPRILPHIINGPFDIGAQKVIPFEQDHGKTESWGFRVGVFAYTTDAKSLNEEAFRILSGVKVWVVDCVREREHPTHSHLEQTLAWIDRVKPQQAFLTHMDTSLDYHTLCAKLPKGVLPAYDGLQIEC
ncbi:MAG: MBL fold metallo-hydrolase [Alphaproteobacteria bacterium]|nr:MBL fold metallo-hydrolase [Alphaproteobacteria bacterium]MBV8549421.1 MBL fold metallo-hydrolase [Alphaproteobacteria bacterium]